MYLSRLILNPRSRAVQRDIAQPHSLHQTVMRAFPDNLNTEADRILYRLDQNRRGEIHLLVQSQGAPDWAHLRDNGYLLPGNVENPAVKMVDLQVKPGQQLAFRLRANPTRRLGKSATYDKGKRVGLYKLEEQLNWLQRKANDHGFRIHSVMPTQQQRIEGRIPRKEAQPTSKTAHDAKFFSVQFDGILQVTDPERFLAAVHAGIGSGKAFGFGLLSVAPVR
ncbi:MAG: type I-E CRISPR-associated protein Cas6/Cse3/CasE [Chloroflexi bacterium]|nr:MAG: type I-E CRISPR-associated protein Cas6/Cse3/CasE [Chloroflexota bacterium]